MIKLNADTLSESIAQRVFARQINLSFQVMKIPLTALLLVITLLFYFLSDSVAWATLAPWAALFYAMLGYRLLTLVFYHWQARRPERQISIQSLAYIYLSGTLFLGVCFASMTIVLLPEVDFKGQLLILLSVIGIAAAAIASMSFRPLPICSFITIMVSPLIYLAYEMAVPNSVAMIVALSIYMAFLIRVAVSFFHTTNEMLWLQLKAVDNEHALFLQKEEAMQANNAKSEFLSRMSHELRTPLNAVIGLNDLMRVDKSEPLTETQNARAIKINEAAQHLLHLMNDVLDLSRVETGDLDVCSESIDVVKVINEVLVLVESKMQSRQITVKFEQSTEQVWLQGDSLRLKQVLFNLIDNAIKYNRKGGMVIIKLVLSGDKFWRVSVADTGYGLTNEDIRKLFVPFSRLGAEQLGIDGTGIGLSYSKQLVELMQGKIGVDSEQGQGSCFWFDLPAAQPSLKRREKSVNEDASHELVSIPPSVIYSEKSVMESSAPKIYILLVEDNLVNQELVIDMLDRTDYIVDVVSNGKSAVDACFSQQYDLVLMDCEMPIMNGVRATEIIRQQGNKVPIIALTAHAVSGAREKCLNSGMNDFLSKPFVANEIQHIVEKWTHSGGKLDENILVKPEEQAQVSKQRHAEQISEIKEQQDLSVNAIIDMTVIGRLQQTKTNSQAAKKKKPLLERVLGMYLEQTPLILQQLTDAVNEKSVEGIVDCAHTLKSSSAAVGATKLTEKCKDIELSGREGNLDLTRMEQRLSEIHHDYQEVAIALNDILVGES